VSSSTPKGTDQAGVLARKAEADAIAVRELAGNPEITDEIVGFHAQQAVEKWLKASMASRGMDGAELPCNAEHLDDLTIYAVPMRYDELLDAEPLNRESTVELIDEVGRWAKNAIRQ